MKICFIFLLGATVFFVFCSRITSNPKFTQEESQSIEIIIEEETPEIPAIFNTSQPELLLLKERKLDKIVKIDKNAQHFCNVKNFRVDLSSSNQATIELELKGKFTKAVIQLRYFR